MKMACGKKKQGDGNNLSTVIIDSNYQRGIYKYKSIPNCCYRTSIIYSFPIIMTNMKHIEMLVCHILHRETLETSHLLVGVNVVGGSVVL